MESDRKLLELAAKAAGIKHFGWVPAGLSFSHRGPWNPLTDDGDALRLASRLRISIIYDGYMVIAKTELARNCGAQEPMVQGDEIATRRAIVRAAAEIGKTLG